MIYFELVTRPLFDGHKVHGNKMFDPKCGFPFITRMVFWNVI